MRKIILFSSTGYVGGYLKEYFLKDSDVQLYEITRLSNWEDYYCNYDIMIYSASASNDVPLKLIQDNVLTAISVIDFCKKHNIKRIIYLSTDSIYGELNTDEVSENAVMVNPSFYGTTKYLVEKIIIKSGIPYYILRLPGIVGKVWKSTYLYRLIDKLYLNETISVYNADKKFNNVIHIEDLIYFILNLCNIAYEGSELFLLGNTEKIELIKIVNYSKSLCHSTSDINMESVENRRYFTLDVSKAIEYGYTSKSIWDIIEELFRLKEHILNSQYEKIKTDNMQKKLDIL